MNAAQRLARLGDRVFDRMRDPRAFALSEADAVDGDFESLRGHQYAVLVTFRRNGDPVPSPVWFAIAEDGAAYLHTASHAGKVKRLRHDHRALLAPSNMRGKPAGPAVRGVGRLLSDEESAHAEEALAAAYGARRRVFERMLGSSGDPGVHIEIRPAGSAGSRRGPSPGA